MRYSKIVLAAVTLALGPLILTAHAQNQELPVRQMPRPETTNGVPHIQLGAVAVPEYSAEILRRVAGLPGVELRNSALSLPGARGFQLVDDFPVAQPQAIIRAREFAHIHPDGSLHASLEPTLAQAAVNAGWAIHHPWANERAGWEGFVMLYTPVSGEELEVVFQLVVSSYEYVTGQIDVIR